MTDLAGFLLARIAEDEQAADEMTENGKWIAECNEPHDAAITALNRRWRFGPERLRAECAAKRRLVVVLVAAQEASRVVLTNDRAPILTTTEEALRLLALPYADHPDYRQEWKP